VVEEVNTTAVVFPFDAFGGNGTGHGAELLGEALTEILDDNTQESRAIRPDAYRGRVKQRDVSFATARALSGWRTVGRQIIRQSIKLNERVLWLGGNHLSVLPVYEELGGDNATKTLVIQFDAHLDIHQMHDVTPNPANGNFLLHAEETLPSIMNIGHRDLLIPQREIDGHFSNAFSAFALATNLPKVLTTVRSRAKSTRRVWIDIDVDVFDPAHMPATQAPLPFGPAPDVILRLLDAAFVGNVIGISISEFDPGRDVSDRGLNLLGWLMEWLLLRWYESEEEEEE
jgi:agmatinase